MSFRIGKKQSVEVPERAVPVKPQTTAEGKLSVAGLEGGTVRISFRMGRDLHRRLKLEAVRQGRTIIGMLEGFVAEHTPGT